MQGIAIVAILKHHLMMLGQEINEEQIIHWARAIADDYPTETLEDIAYCCNRAIKKRIYGKFNISNFYSSMEEHLHNKAIERESSHNSIKHDNYERISGKGSLKDITDNALKQLRK